MSQLRGCFCDKCKLLELDDRALGGKVLINDGIQRPELPLDTPDLAGVGNVTLQYQLADQIPELPELTHKAQSGCVFCRLLKSSIDTFILASEPQESRTIDITLKYRWSQSKNKMPGLTGLFVDLEPRMSGFHKLQSLKFLINSCTGCPDECTQWLNLNPPLIADALHPRNLSMIQEELEKCQRQHEHYTGDSTSFLPTRLIDVGDGQGLNRLRLVITDSWMRQNRPLYAALSYCWGSPNDAATQFTTETETLQHRQHGFSFHSMTQVMKDAIIVAKALRIRYIWIDALCIIQNDKSDWELESSTMADVYRQAHVTICTPASSSCHIGFLDRNPKSVSIPFQSKINSSIAGSFTLSSVGLVVSNLHVTEDLDLTYDELYNDHSSWSRRGWTFQEDVLSTRQLHFGSFELTYQCRDHIQSEAGIQTLPGEGALEVAHDLAHASGRNNLWNGLMVRFMDRELGRETDRLPAISGLARLMGFGHENYYAGLWRNSLVVDLCWYTQPTGLWLTETREEITHPTGPYIAPSWSWAARKQSITHYIDMDDYRSEVESIVASTQPAGIDPFGQVGDGLLEVRGKLVPFPSNALHDPDARRKFGYKGASLHKSNKRVAWFLPDWKSSGKEEDCSNLSMLLLTSFLWLFKGLKLRTRVGFGIVLYPSSIRGEYIRVGSFQTDRGGFHIFRVAKSVTVKII